MRLKLPWSDAGRWLVAYDISDDRRRTRVAKLLLAQGQRLQKSVYEADLTPDRLRGLVRGLTPLVHRWEDRLDLVPLCTACRRRRRWLGRDGALEPPGFEVV